MARRVVLIALALFPSLLRAETLPIRSYTTADGLAADHINCIVPDSRGFLWFCTNEGLSRFDGYRFVTYTTTDGLADDTINTVFETRSGKLYAGTGRGISRMNPGGAGAAFTTHAPSGAGNFAVVALGESASGKIWCATQRALFEWDGERTFRKMEFRLSDPRAQIYNVLEDHQGVLWISTSAGIFGLRAGAPAFTFTEKDGIPGDRVNSVVLDSKGRMWAVARNGLARFDQRADGNWKLARAYTRQSGLAGNGPIAATQSSDGILWVATDEGISRLTLGPGEPALLKNIGREQGLTDRVIVSLAEDSAGNLWAGGGGGGAMRIDRMGFTTYRESDGLPTDRVWSVFEDRGGELIVLTVTGRAMRSVNIFDSGRFRNIALPVFNGRATWLHDRILLQSRSGEWWAATTQGLCRFPATTGAASLTGREPRVCYAPGATIFHVFEDSKGGVWASAQSSHRDELMRWDPATQALVTFPNPKLPGGPTDNPVDSFAEDSQGNIWMGLYYGGLYRYDGRSFLHLKPRDGVSGGRALLAAAGSLWIGSGGRGLGRITDTAAAHPLIQIFDTARGLSSNIVDCMIDDGMGRIYAATAKGVDRIDPKTGHIRHYSSANGLPHGTCMSAWRDRSGALWFATTQGLAKLTPGAERRAVQPRIFLTDLRLGGSPYPLSHLGATAISQLELKPSENQLQVDFVGIDYEPGDVLRYSYKLEGSSDGWSAPRSQHSVNYAALESGTYRFLVKAITSEGAESAVPAEIVFRVLPPLWRRWWFESLAVALAAAAVFAAHRYRVAQAVNLERVRTAIATDLHDDIGASLSQIAILTEVARVGGASHGHTGDPLEKVASLARELIDSMSDIVWSIRPEPDGVDSLIRRMREFALDLLAPQGIAFELRTPRRAEDLQFTLQARRQVLLMFKECIHNAARHSHATTVTAELAVEDRELALTVADNGDGLNGKPPAGGTGIEGMRRRAGSLGGSVDLTSAPGEGCSVTIRLPARHGAFSRPDL